MKINFLFQLLSEYPICNEITVYGTFMCPEYGIYHTRYPNSNMKFYSNEEPQFIPLTDTKVNYLY